MHAHTQLHTVQTLSHTHEGAHTHTLTKSLILTHMHTSLEARPPPFASETSQSKLVNAAEVG